MDLFFSTFVNKVDRKGRVSVPATFRAAVADQSFPGIIVFPSFKYAALDASGIKRMEEMSSRMDTLEEFSEDHENLGMLFASSHSLPFDPEGRIILPETLTEHAHITESAAFVGLGKSFQIWEPARFRAELAEATEKVRALRQRLGSQKAADGPHGARE